MWGEVGTCSGHRKSMEQALLWHRDCNDLMFYVVFKGLKDCVTLKRFFIFRTYFSPDIFCLCEHFKYNSRERKRNQQIWECVSVSSVGWSFWCKVDRLFHWAAPLLLQQVNHFVTQCATLSEYRLFTVNFPSKRKLSLQELKSSYEHK